MTTALITGCLGFCAAELMRQLRGEEIRIVGVDLLPAPASSDGRARLLDEYVQTDVRDPDEVLSLLARVNPDLIFHLAAKVGGDAEEIYRANLLGTVNILEGVRHISLPARILMVGSAAEYGRQPEHELPARETAACRPEGAYAVSKFLATQMTQDYARRYGIQALVARPFNIVGPGIPASYVVGALLRRAQDALQSGSRAVAVGNIESVRDFISLQDAVRGYRMLMAGGECGEIYNICSGRACSIRGLAESLFSHADRPLVLAPGAAPSRPEEIAAMYGDGNKAAQLGFKAEVPLEECLMQAWRFAMEGRA